MNVPTKDSFHITQIGSIPFFSSNHPWFALISHAITSQAKFHHVTPALLRFHFNTQRTPFPKPNLPPIFLYHQNSLYLPHPDSISHMGYISAPSRPHRSHCDNTQGRIPLWFPVPDAVVYPVVLRGSEYIINPENSHSLSTICCSQRPVLVR